MSEVMKALRDSADLLDNDLARVLNASAGFEEVDADQSYEALVLKYPLHGQMALTLLAHGIDYNYRLDEDTPANDATNFTIDEALTACACLANAGDCDLVTRVAANRASLMSLDVVYPG